MCINLETILKIIGLVINASIPILILILGIRMTKRVEDAETESAKKYFWENRLANTFYDKFTKYSENVAELISNLELLRSLINNGNQNDNYGTDIQNKIVIICKIIFKEYIELKIYINNLFVDNIEILNSFEKVWVMISSLINDKQGNVLEIYEELKILNNLTAKQFNKGY